jgi:hypothetical protein
MRTAPPRSTRGARGPVPTARLPVGPANHPASRLKILVAGVDKDARGPIEARVRHALGRRSASEAWTVSLVKLGSRWSVTIDAGEHSRSVSLTTDDGGLEQAIRRAVDADATSPPAPRPAVPEAARVAPAPILDRHVCQHCEGGLLVAYESPPGEPKELAPVACPHCWQINHVEIGAWAAAGREYRCDKAS